MDNATRKELLYKARAVGYPGSILDVFANYDQGRDLIGEFQQQQQMQQAQQMSDMAAQQVGMQQPQQQPQQQMQPQMPVVPSSPTPAPKFTPPQPPAPIGVQSQDSPMGIVSGQSGPNQGRAIFATGGFTEGDPIKDAYAAYAKSKLAQITDPRTGKLLPTNDPRAQIDLRETMWNRQPTKENRTVGTIEERRQALGYPTNMGENDLFFNRSEGVGELPMRAVKTGIAGLIENKWIVDKNGKGTLNPNYKGKLDEDGKEWAEKAVSKYGLDPAVIGYFNQSAMSDSKKTLADYDPSLLLPSERYSKQPTIVVGEIGDQLTWSTRKGDIMTKKNVADEEGQSRVVGATNMSGVDIPKKKKATGGFTETDPPSYTLPTLEVKATRNNPVPKMLETGFKEELAYQEAKNKLRLRQELEGAQARFMGGENFLDAFKDHNLAGQAFQTMVERYPNDKRLTSKETTRAKAVGSFLIQKAIERYLGKKLPTFSNNQNYQYAVEGIKRGNNMVGPIFEIKQFQDAERDAQNQYSNYTEELQDKVDTYEKAHGTYQPGLFERMRKTHFKFATGGPVCYTCVGRKRRV